MKVNMKFMKKFMSHKFKARGLKMEVGVCIITGDIVWIHGPARCGKNDVTLAREAFIGFLDNNEKAVADRGYVGEDDHLKTPSIWHYQTDKEKSIAHIAGLRHETVNGRLKIFQVLTKPFRHSLDKHSSCFRAVAVITQLNIENGSPLFQVEYHDEGNNFS
ncbi:hypothetical protein ACHAWF_000064 [Thalassiosira exigua]